MQRLIGSILVAAAMPAAAQIAPVGPSVMPGMWEITTTVSAMSMPNLPPAAAAAMKRPIVIHQCLTKEEATRGPQEMLKRDKSCRFTRYAASGGNVDAVMTCRQPGGTMTVASKGAFTPTSFTTTANMAMTGAQSMKMSAQAKGRRTGAC